MAPGLTRARQGPRGGPGTCSLSLGGSGGSVCVRVCVGRACEVCVCFCAYEFLHACISAGGVVRLSLCTAKNLTSVSQSGDDGLLQQNKYIVRKATRCTEILYGKQSLSVFLVNLKGCNIYANFSLQLLMVLI